MVCVNIRATELFKTEKIRRCNKKKEKKNMNSMRRDINTKMR